jgi:hypothetical protein
MFIIFLLLLIFFADFVVWILRVVLFFWFSLFSRFTLPVIMFFFFSFSFAFYQHYYVVNSFLIYRSSLLAYWAGYSEFFCCFALLRVLF